MKKLDSHCRKVGWSGIARRLTCGDDLYPALMLHGDGSPEQQASADLMHSQAAMTRRSEEHTSELQSLMRILYAVFCLKKKNIIEHDNKRLAKTENEIEII